MAARGAASIWATVVAPVLGCVLQIIAFYRLARRLPDDWVGICIYSATLAAFALTTIAGYVRCKEER